MSVNVTISGTTYAFPTNGEQDWGTVVTNWAVAVSSQLLQRTGGSFSLTNDVNFGATFATVQTYLKSRTSNISATGFVRMARADALSWRNQANGADLPLAVDSSNRLTFNGHVIIPSTGVIQPTEGGTGISSYATGDTIYASASNVLSKLSIGTVSYVYISDGSIPGWGQIVNASVSAAAAIAYSKLSLTGSIVNADINASAAIAYSKLALTGSIVNADINASAAIAYSKLSLTGSIVNADINASAAIARSKVATGTAYRVLANSSAGAMGENAALTSNRLVYGDTNGQLASNAALTQHRVLVADANGLPANNAALTQHRVLVADVNGELANNAALTAANVVYADSNGELAGEATLATSRGGTNLSGFTTGDILYASSSSVLSKLGIGAGGTFLKSTGSAPSWSTASATYAVQSKSSGFTVDSSIDVYELNTASAFNITIPAAGTNTGKVWYLLKTSSDFNAATLITGLSTTINTQNECLQILDDGSSIVILNHRINSAFASQTMTGSWDNTTYTCQARRVGDSLQCWVKLATTGVPTSATQLLLTLPNSLTIDTTKLTNSDTNNYALGIGTAEHTGSASFNVRVGYGSSTQVALSVNDVSTYVRNANLTKAVPFNFGNGDFVYVNFTVPISGWNG